MRKTKNVSRDAFGSKLGRIHMEKQDLSKVRVRKLKGLKKSVPEAGADDDDGDDDVTQSKRQKLDESVEAEMESE